MQLYKPKVKLNKINCDRNQQNNVQNLNEYISYLVVIHFILHIFASGRRY